MLSPAFKPRVRPRRSQAYCPWVGGAGGWGLRVSPFGRGRGLLRNQARVPESGPARRRGGGHVPGGRRDSRSRLPARPPLRGRQREGNPQVHRSQARRPWAGRGWRPIGTPRQPRLSRTGVSSINDLKCFGASGVRPWICFPGLAVKRVVREIYTWLYIYVGDTFMYIYI